MTIRRVRAAIGGLVLASVACAAGDTRAAVQDSTAIDTARTTTDTVRAIPATVTRPARIYRRPDLITVTGKRVELLELVVIVRADSQWVEIVDSLHGRSGWIAEDAVSMREDDVALARQMADALAQDDEVLQLAALVAIIENANSDQSPLWPAVRGMAMARGWRPQGATPPPVSLPGRPPVFGGTATMVFDSIRYTEEHVYGVAIHLASVEGALTGEVRRYAGLGGDGPAFHALASSASYDSVTGALSFWAFGPDTMRFEGVLRDSVLIGILERWIGMQAAEQPVETDTLWLRRNTGGSN